MPLAQKSDMMIGKVAAAVFSLQLKLTSPNDAFIHFDVEGSNQLELSSYWFQWLAIITVILIRREGKSLKRQYA